MTNREIVDREKMLNGISGDLLTYKEWQKRKMQVKKGEHAKVSTQLWKKVSYKDKATGDKKERLMLCNAHLFTIDQVTTIEKQRAYKPLYKHLKISAYIRVYKL